MPREHLNLLKKIKTILNKSVLCALFLLLFTIVFCGRFERDDDIDVTFFDVGQGHSTLINIPNGPSILIDAGEGIGDEQPRESTKKDIIVDRIEHHIKKSRPTNQGTYDLLLMATHADRDHSAWLPYIYRNLKGRIEDIRVVSFFGGNPKEYGFEAGLIRELKTSQREILGINHLFASEVEYDVEQLHPDFLRLSQFGPANLRILAMNKSIPRPKDTNPSSLVIRFEYGVKSVMISGDAPGDIIDDLLARTMHKERQYESLRSDILLLSHHGAKENGTNSMGWLDAVKPKYGVISAGFQQTYKHPTAAALTRLVAVMDKDLKVEPHEVASFGNVASYITDTENFIPLRETRGRLKYSYYRTNYPIFATRQSGDISFSWGLEDPSVKINFENPPIPGADEPRGDEGDEEGDDAEDKEEGDATGAGAADEAGD